MDVGGSGGRDPLLSVPMSTEEPERPRSEGIQGHEGPRDDPPSGDADDRLLVLGRPVGRPVQIAAGLLLLVVVAVGGWWSMRSEKERTVTPPGEAAVDVWAPFWTIDETVEDGTERLGVIREFSPFWFEVVGVDEIRVDPGTPTAPAEELLDIVDDRWIVPSLRDHLPAGGMAAIIADPDQRRRHVEAILEFAEEVDADGIDLDYEQFAFADGFDTWETTRPNWVAFVAELSDELHATGRTLSVSIPAIWDRTENGSEGYWVYDHAAIAPHVDAMRIMAYDYSVVEPGPIAPIWWVEDVVRSVSEVVPAEYHDRLVLGVPSFGTNWVVSTVGECPPSADGRVGLTARSALDLAERRGGTPEFDPLHSEWRFTYDLEFTEGDLSCVQSREVWWVDSEGVEARAMAARNAGWGGLSLWALGYDDAEVWQAFVGAAQQKVFAGSAGDGG